MNILFDALFFFLNWPLIYIFNHFMNSIPMILIAEEPSTALVHKIKCVHDCTLCLCGFVYSIQVSLPKKKYSGENYKHDSYVHSLSLLSSALTWSQQF